MHDAILAAAETAAQNDGKGLYKFFEIVFKNLATINDFIARGLGSSISGDTGVEEGKGFKSVFHFFHQKAFAPYWWIRTENLILIPKTQRLLTRHLLKKILGLLD